MEINDLFSNKSTPPVDKNSDKKDISVLDSFLIRPLIQGLGSHFNITEDKPDVCVWKLREGQTDCAVISAIDYASGKGNWKIVPGLCVATHGPSRHINLFFTANVRELNKIAIEPGYNTSNALLKIIMKEKYEIAPEYIEISGSLQDKLHHADAALLTGIQAFHEQGKNQYSIDLGEEWYDLSGLPFVYALWAINDLSFKITDLKKIVEAASEMDRNKIESAKDISEQTPYDWGVYHELFEENAYFRMGLEEQDGLREFFRLAFYHGLIDHIPDLHFIKTSG